MPLNSVPPNQIIHRSVDIPCPSGKHQRSLVTFRNHTVAAMFCIPCEHAWTEATTHPALLNMPLDKERERDEYPDLAEPSSL